MALVELSYEAWSNSEQRHPFSLSHGLATDERLTHEAIAELAGRLPITSVEMNRAELDPRHAADGSPPLDLAPDQLAREIETQRRWMAIKNIQQDPCYRLLVDDALASADLGLRLGRAMVAQEGYIFLSAAHAVTPAHVDHEHNLLLQICGTKNVTIGGFPNAEVEHQHMQDMHSGRYGRTGFTPYEPQTFRLEPGTGVYIPPRGVHMVETHDTLSISLSLVFHTERLERAARVYAANAKLRRLGLKPRPPEHSLAVDRAKSGVVLAWKKIRQMTS